MRYFIISVVSVQFFCRLTQKFYGYVQVSYPTKSELETVAQGGVVSVQEVSEEDYLQFFELAQ